MLDFCSIDLINKKIAEITFHEGTEVNESMVKSIHRFLCNNLEGKFSLLVNNEHSYCFNCGAVLSFGTIDEIGAIAFTAKNSCQKEVVDYLIHFPREKKLNSRLFSRRDSAYEWLKAAQ